MHQTIWRTRLTSFEGGQPDWRGVLPTELRRAFIADAIAGAGDIQTFVDHQPSTAILEVAVHAGFDALDTVPHVLTYFEVLDQSLIKAVQPEEVPNPVWLTSASASTNQQKFTDTLLASHTFVLIPSSVTRHSWSLLISCELAKGKYRVVHQERFGLDTRLVRG
ncbi:RES family NAD+ phosphorylase [Pseudomonas syringae group genomosp. 3]|uniref:RES family NAD+ phosphorylase n=1 Tax=Pseudomonas syringae group genomosp. 3 TaxID=251701 RepID=UPI001F48F57A|nr:RES family NAD+ phosphorylase [Pseudomonas syringae group genomosp. 3]